MLNEPFIRFYAGAPLITSSGHRLGSLCVIDRKPRELEAQSCNVLINFAEIVVRELEKDRAKVREPSAVAVLEQVTHDRNELNQHMLRGVLCQGSVCLK